MDGSDTTSTVRNKLCLRNNSAIVNTTVVLFLLLAMLAEHRNSPRAGILHALGATIWSEINSFGATATFISFHSYKLGSQS